MSVKPSTTCWRQALSGVDYVVITFALWTVVCNATTFSSGSLVDLESSFGMVIVAFLAGSLVLHRRLRRLSTNNHSSLGADASFSIHHKISLLLLVGLAMTIALIAHRPDADDTFYVNLAVNAVDNPSGQILAGVVPIYMSHSLEILMAAISMWLDIPTIAIFHLLLSAGASADVVSDIASAILAVGRRNRSCVFDSQW
jgi:hypothetical protein